MNANVPSHALLLCSREFALVCTPDGRILEADPRALHHLQLLPGENLVARAASGADGKVRRMLTQARADPSDAWEVGLVHQGRVLTVRFHTQATGTGPTSTLRLLGSLAPEDAQAIAAAHSAALDEVVTLNRHVVRQRAEADRLNAALTDSNAGVLALQAALEDRLSASTKEASTKTRIVQHLSHELRTPLHSVLGLAEVLLAEQGGPLNAAQRAHIAHIQTAGESASLLVSDLLDLHAIEEGSAEVRPERFALRGFVSALRGALQPLALKAPSVELVIEDPDETMVLVTDRRKLGKVLRNLVSNALRFTPSGQVTVRVRSDERHVVFGVEDTGPGIALDDQARIFEELVRLPSAEHTKGSGLGLPVARGLARLLGGGLTLQSLPGVGSVFEASVLRVHPSARQARPNQGQAGAPARADGADGPVLVVEDDLRTRAVYGHCLQQAGFPFLVAASIPRAQAMLEQCQPVAVLLDLLLGREGTWRFLCLLKDTPSTADIPILVGTVQGQSGRARALGADGVWLRPLQPHCLTRQLGDPGEGTHAATVLVIDDSPHERSLVRALLAGTPHHFVEAESGEEGIRLARTHQPDLIVVDFFLGDGTALDVLDVLKADPTTRSIAAIVATPRQPTPEQLGRLSQAVGRGPATLNLSKEVAIHRVRDALAAAGVHPRVETGTDD